MQTEFFNIRIPKVPPGINKTYLRADSKVILTPDARAWLLGAGHMIGARAGILDFGFDHQAKYVVHLVWAGRGHDADAHIKIVQDAVFEKLGANDEIVSTILIQKLESGEEFVDVHIYREDVVTIAVGNLSKWYEKVV